MDSATLAHDRRSVNPLSRLVPILALVATAVFCHAGKTGPRDLIDRQQVCSMQPTDTLRWLRHRIVMSPVTVLMPSDLRERKQLRVGFGAGGESSNFELETLTAEDGRISVTIQRLPRDSRTVGLLGQRSHLEECTHVQGDLTIRLVTFTEPDPLFTDGMVRRFRLVAFMDWGAEYVVRMSSVARSAVAQGEVLAIATSARLQLTPLH